MKFPKAKPTGKTEADLLMDEAASLALSRAQLGRLRYAMTIRDGTKGERRRANEIVAEIRREIMAGVAETVALERLRGGEVEDFNTAGAKRLSSRDGLLSLYKSGKLEPRLAAAGLGYRRAREAEQRLGVGRLGEVTSGGLVDTVGMGLLRAKLAVAASRVDRDVALELKARPDALDTLRRVAGDGQCLRSLTAGGKQFVHALGGLSMALEIAVRYVASDPT